MRKEWLPLATADERCEVLTERNPNLLIPWFLMACIAYDKYDTPILSDGCFDALSARMAKLWDTLTHRHKGLIRMTDPKTFKGSSVAVDWDNVPGLTYGATEHLIKVLDTGRS